MFAAANPTFTADAARKALAPNALPLWDCQIGWRRSARTIIYVTVCGDVAACVLWRCVCYHFERPLTLIVGHAWVQWRTLEIHRNWDRWLSCVGFLPIALVKQYAICYVDKGTVWTIMFNSIDCRNVDMSFNTIASTMSFQTRNWLPFALWHAIVQYWA